MQVSKVCVRSSLTLLAFVVFATPAVAQETVTVRGTVTGANNDPKQFAGVSFDGPGHYVATTDASGAFTIQSVAAGRYTVRVRQGDRVDEFPNRAVGTSLLRLVVTW